MAGRNRVLAELIAERLFTNGLHQKANRLVLELQDGRYGGGWGKKAATDVIEDELVQALDAGDPRAKSS